LGDDVLDYIEEGKPVLDFAPTTWMRDTRWSHLLKSIDYLVGQRGLNRDVEVDTAILRSGFQTSYSPARTF
jgi:hypothetical protein